MKARTLNNSVNKKRNSYIESIEILIRELESISGLKLLYNDFPGDGLGVCIDDGSTFDTYMSIHDLLKVIDIKGTFTADDIQTTL